MKTEGGVPQVALYTRAFNGNIADDRSLSQGIIPALHLQARRDRERSQESDRGEQRSIVTNIIESFSRSMTVVYII